MYFTINNKDFSGLVSALKPQFETLVSEKSGRNANGDTVVDVVNRKIKLNVTLRHTTAAEMAEFLNALNDYVVNVAFLHPKTRAMATITAYHGTPEPDYYTISDKTLFKPLSISFVEL